MTNILVTKALTVRQPSCWASVYAGKSTENRTWSTSVRGWIGLHAGLRFDEVAARTPLVLDAWTKWTAGLPGRDGRPASRLFKDGMGMDRGAFIGVAELVDVHEAAGNCCGPWGEQAHDGVSIFHWRYADVLPIQPLIYAIGRQGLWTPTAAQAAALTQAARAQALTSDDSSRGNR
jgi:hypothetical protein